MDNIALLVHSKIYQLWWFPKIHYLDGFATKSDKLGKMVILPLLAYKCSCVQKCELWVEVPRDAN
jgi:hypothetical protein